MTSEDSSLFLHRFWLLGAGASLPLGIPLASQLMSSLVMRIAESGSSTALTQLGEILKSLREERTTFDFEDVFERARQEEMNELVNLITSLLAIILYPIHHRNLWEDTVDTAKNRSQFEYLRGLFHPGSVVMSLNFDLVLETASRCQCNQLIIPKCAAEMANWNRVDAMLLKVHGNLNWIFPRIGREDIDATRVVDSNIDYPDEWRSSDNQVLCLGKSGKLRFDPLREIFNQGISLATHSFRCIVVGYSFRDEHINQLLAGFEGVIFVCNGLDFYIDYQRCHDPKTLLGSKPKAIFVVTELGATEAFARFGGANHNHMQPYPW